jgi:hypothetical protein
MKLLSKVRKKIKKALIKVFKAKNIIHSFDIDHSFINSNFGFNQNFKVLSDNAINRIFSFAENIEKNVDIHQKEDMWNIIGSDSDHKNILKFCLEKNKEKFLDLILSSGKSKLVWGFLLGIQYDNLINSKKNREKEAIQILDKLVSLSEFNKLIKVYNPEQGGWIIEDIDVEKLINGNFSINNLKIFNSPKFTFGIKIKEKFLCEKDIIGFYFSNKLYKIIKQYNLNEVNEIGAGLGYGSYYLYSHKNINYNIYDIPSVVLMQAYFLMSSLGEDKIYLSGEKKLNKPTINLFPYWEIFTKNKTDSALWFSQDSFPEIDKKLCEKYVEKIKLSSNSYLFSMNQEARNFNSVGDKQHTVFDLMKETSETSLINRSRDFLRLGYIEELYKL